MDCLTRKGLQCLWCLDPIGVGGVDVVPWDWSGPLPSVIVVSWGQRPVVCLSALMAPRLGGFLGSCNSLVSMSWGACQARTHDVLSTLLHEQNGSHHNLTLTHQQLQQANLQYWSGPELSCVWIKRLLDFTVKRLNVVQIFNC